MAAIANIVIKDSASADHTFTPQSAANGNEAHWQETVSGIRVGFPLIHLTQRPPNQQARTTKTVLQLVEPVLEVTAGSTGAGYQAAPRVAFRSFMKLEAVVHERSTLLQRQDLRALYYNLLNNPQIINALVGYEMPV